eukprot:TRINITY_DN9089_c0_g1_i1.p2 TRINITY_DN9089_c0_g1~~TRINITY_DN9089_c0_g1_i1.p2  ORF type:complete len:125 (+),score=25.83 TRINITY_DN9089_c0_g1_i1:148-522(+)
MVRDLRFQTRMAMAVLRCGRRRVWLDPNQKEVIAEARTRADIRGLIAEGVVKVKQAMGGGVPVPGPVRLRKLLMDRKRNEKMQKRENRARAIEKHHTFLREEYGWVPKQKKPYTPRRSPSTDTH